MLRLNLDNHFDLPCQDWSALARRIDEMVRKQPGKSSCCAEDGV
jgi:hypothetical protein